MRHEDDGLAVRRVQIPGEHHERLHTDVRFRRMQRRGPKSKAAQRRAADCCARADVGVGRVLHRQRRQLFSNHLGLPAVVLARKTYTHTRDVVRAIKHARLSFDVHVIIIP